MRLNKHQWREKMEIKNNLQTRMISKTFDNLTKALDYESANHQVISGNMANVDTPGYRQMSLKFDEQLQLAEGKASAALNKTDARHLSGLSGADGGFYIESKKTAGIDMDSEMAKLTKNNLLYEANTRLLTKKILALKAAIKGSY
jgi:flagellar basal-body rod protein FlgB